MNHFPSLRWLPLVICLLGLSAYSVGGLAGAQAADSDPAPATPTETVAWLELSGPLRDGPPKFSLGPITPGAPNYRQLLARLQKLSHDDQCQGLVVYLDDPWLDLAQVDGLGRAFQRLRDAGKTVVVYAEEYSLISYLLACSASRIALQERGEVNLVGLGLEEMYLAGLFEKVGVQADYIQVGKYKGADEALTRTGPSPEWTANIDALLDDLYDQIVSRIAQARKLKRPQVEALLRDSWVMTDQQYLDRQVVDVLTDRTLTKITGDLFGEDFTWVDLSEPAAAHAAPSNPLALLGMLLSRQRAPLTRNAIALVHLQGPIVPGHSNSSLPQAQGLFGDSTVGSRTIIAALEEAGETEHVQGVVLRIDSPGGSALASELIWQAVRKLSEIVPVYVSVGSEAASGGYYVACAGDYIFVEPGSIVGSIGVVGGKIIFGGLYDKLGLKVQRRSRGPLGDMFNSAEPFTAPQREAIEQSMRKVYAQFLDRVHLGRDDRLENVDAVAEGRLFTGRQAVANGLADEIGSVQDAIASLAGELELVEGEYDVIDLPPAPSFPEYLESLVSHMQVSAPATAGPLLTPLTQLIDPRLWQRLAPALQGLLLLQREPVLTLQANPIIIR